MAPAATSVAQRAFRHIGALLFVALTAVAGVAISGGTVSAHTAFSGSTPSDGDVLDAPVELVSLVFTGESEEAGDGFVVLDASGTVREPTSVSTLDNKVFTLTFDPPLAGGEIGVRWSVRAPDKHPIEGAFSFTVTAPVPETTTVPAVPPTDDTAPTTTAAGATAPVDDDMSEMTPAEMASMDEFLTVDATRPGESQATLGRVLSFAGVTLAIGGIAFLWTTLRGERAEIRLMVNALRIVGVVIAVGAVIEYSGVARIAGDSLVDAWSSGPGFAAVLRLVSGVAVAVGLAVAMSAARGSRPARSLSSAARTTTGHDETAFWGRDESSLSDPGLSMAAQQTVGATPDPRPSPQRNTVREPMQQWVPNRSSAIAFVGCGLMVVSFWLDGHTVSEGWRPLHALSNSVHIVAGSVWMGGVVAMAAVMWTRHRRGVRSRALEMVVRFSSVATVALGAVVIAGLVMAVSILDSFGELTGTEWGQLLLLKSGAAGLAMLGGAYNHFRLIPALDADPDDPDLRDRMRSVVTAEAILLIFVVIVTAWLVAAAT